MEKFQFKYQNLLELKEKQEAFIKNQISAAMEKLKEEQNVLQKFETVKEQYVNMIHLKMTDGISAIAIRSCDLYIKGVNKKITYQMEIIEQIHQDINKLRKTLLQTSKEKKAFEKLREKAQDHFHLIEKKEEEGFIDQFVTFRNFTNH